MKTLISIAALACVVAGCANPVPTKEAPKEFPAGAITPSAADLQKQLADNRFLVRLADGTEWRLQYRNGGDFFVDTSTNYQDHGPWTTEDGKLCVQTPRIARSCNDVRIVDSTIYLKRSNGKVIRYEPR